MRSAIRHLKQADPRLGEVIQRIGPYRMEYREPVFDTLVRSIVYQQISGKAAVTILQRLRTAARVREHLTPKKILALTPEQMRAAGLSPQKQAYLRDLAEQTQSGQVRFSHLPDLPDEEVIAHLLPVKGVGVWTAQMFLIFALRRPDVLPVNDLGVQVGIQRAYGLAQRPGPKEVALYGEKWRPYCSVASWYLWRSLDGPAEL